MMRGPAIDLVLLALLTLFVGIQQYARPQLRNRLWFAGWGLFFLSYVVWEFHLSNPALDKLRDAVRFDLLLLGQLTFVVSFVASAKQLRRVVLAGLVIGVPAVLVFNTHEISFFSLTMLVPAVVLWQGYGIYGTKTLMPQSWRVRRLLILCICLGYGSAFVAHLLLGNKPDVQDWVLAELLLCSAVLYGAEGRRNLASIAGTVGFLAWAAFYLLAAGLDLPLLTGWRYWVGVFWNVPKFVVAFSMVLQMSEDARSEKEQLADRYRDLYEDFRLLYERNTHPMWIYDEATSRFLSANRAALRAYGYSERELLEMSVMDLVAEPEQDEEPPAGAAAERLGEPVRLRHRLKDGLVIAVDVTEHRTLFQGEPARFVMAVDVTKLERESRELLYRAHHDALTGLPNRHELDSRIDACLARCDRDNRMAALLTIDVDHFKQINDTYGHGVGDECLKAVAARLQSRIRQVDTLARSGGEEFTAIIGALHGAKDAHKVASMLLGIFEKPLELPKLQVYITISIGVALFPDDSTDRDTLKQQSDEALYEAKRRGRNQAVFAAPRRDPSLLSAGTAELPVD
jgi:diguanylate cyclase (GGDEF)-like protein/PAS domain S-box-containing protein